MLTYISYKCVYQKSQAQDVEKIADWG